jgi:signal transduction histidine kinase
MNAIKRPYGYRGGYLLGLIVFLAVALRTILFYQGQPNLVLVLLLLIAFALLYVFEPLLSNRLPGYNLIYFPVQTVLLTIFCYLPPFMDMKTILVVPLLIQIFRTFSGRLLIFLTAFYILLVGAVILPNLGFLEGMAFILLGVAVSAFFISYDFLYSRTRADEAESERLLADLQSAHLKLQEYAAQAEELAAVQERNRLARELHDSVSQAIFSITLTSQSARLLLEREPDRVPEVLERLQTMTASALSQLRSLIAELRPQ